MKQFRIILLMLAVLMIGALTFVQAEEDDNACYAGGALDSKCESDWEWICGYYLDQWTEAGGWNGNYPFPDWCDPASLLPPKPEVPATVTSLTGCYNDGDSWSFYYNGVSGSGLMWYENLNCSGEGTSYDDYGIEAADYDTALAACEGLGLFRADVWNLADDGYNSPANLWGCYGFSGQLQ